VVEAPAEVAPTKVVDLMAALEASVQEAQKARKRHPSVPKEEQEEAPAPAKSASKKGPAKKAPAKKTAAKKAAAAKRKSA
jgi:DNA end-binding protein Ku